MKPSNRITFIVPVRNDAAGLDRCLQKIRENGLPSDTLEIVVADNGSTDRSIQVARTHGANVVTIERARVAELRNRAARHATGDVLAFVDADHEIAPCWGSVALACLQDATVGIVGAQYRPPADGTWVQRAYGFLRGHADGIREVDWLGSGNLALRMTTFQGIGGFDSTLETCEDVDLCSRVKRRGLRIVSHADLASIHHGDPETLASLFLAELWRGRDNIRVSFRRPIIWSLVPSALIAVIDAALVLIAIASVVVMLRSVAFGMTGFAFAALTLSSGTALRVGRAAVRNRTTDPATVAQIFLVTWVYDLARALSLFTRVRHRRDRGTR